MEIWQPAFGFEGIYEVSSLGRVRRLLAATGAQVGGTIKPYEQPNGYLQLSLRKAGRYIKVYVHRLVLMSFTNERSPTVNHKNGDRADCRLTNLEWMSHSENLTHACRVLGQRIGTKHWAAKLDPQKVRKARQLRTSGWTHQKIADHFHVSRLSITHMLIGKSWKHVT